LVLTSIYLFFLFSSKKVEINFVLNFNIYNSPAQNKFILVFKEDTETKSRMTKNKKDNIVFERRSLKEQQKMGEE